MNDNMHLAATFWFLIAMQGVWHVVSLTWHCWIAETLFHSWTSIATTEVLEVKTIKGSSTFSNVFSGEGQDHRVNAHQMLLNTLSSAASAHLVKKGIPRDAKDTQGNKISTLISTKDDSIYRGAFPTFHTYPPGVDTTPLPNAAFVWAALHVFCMTTGPSLAQEKMQPNRDLLRRPYNSNDRFPPTPVTLGRGCRLPPTT